MTISTTIPEISYNGDGSTVAFPIPFPFDTPADLKVIQTDENGATAVLTSGFSVSGGDGSTGTLTFTTAPDDGVTITILDDPELKQSVDYVSNDPFPAETHEAALDRGVRISKRLRQLIKRCLRTADGDPSSDDAMVLPSVLNRAGKFLRFDSGGSPEMADFDGSGTPISASIIGALLYPITDAEGDAGFSASELSLGYPVGDVRRYRIVPNDDTARTANTRALKKLIDATGTSTYRGRVTFPNTTGSDVYYFDDIIEVKDGVSFIGNGCTLHFAKSYESADDTMGFLTFIRDVSLQDLTIEIDYDGTGGVNAGNGLRIGSRPGYRFGAYTDGIEEEDLDEPMGNIRLRNVTVCTNNPVAAPVLLLGGLDGLLSVGLRVDGQGVATKGVYYEFGFWHTESTAANRKSSHARNLHFLDTRIADLDTASGSAFELAGAMNATVDGLWMDGAFSGAVLRSGEALFYNQGTPTEDMRPHISLRNIYGKNIASVGISLQGAESASGGYLSSVIAALAAGPEAAAQTDLIRFSLDGFSIDADGAGLMMSGPALVRNGALNGTASSGQVIITDECTAFTLDNVRILGSSNVGIRASFGSAIYSPARLKAGVIQHCVIAGNTGAGIALANCRSVLIQNNVIGHNEAYTGQTETTQTNGVHVGTTGSGVVCRGNYVSTSGGAAAYAMLGSGTGNAIENPLGTATFTGAWEGVLQSADLTLTAVTPGDLAVTYSERTIEYIKRGKRVDYQIRLETSAFTHTTASGNLRITGLPFTVDGTATGYSPGAMSLQGVTKASYTQFTAAPARSSTYMHIEASGSGQNVAIVAITDLPTGGTVRLRASGHYFVA